MKYVYWQVLNTKNYGIPQNRERIFIVGFKDFKAQISLRDKFDKKKYIGSDENWIKAEESIVDAAKEKSGHRRDRPGQKRPVGGESHVAAHIAKRLADDVQPRLAGGQGAVV